MASPLTAFSQMAGMLAIVLVGYVAGKLDYLDDHTVKHLSRFVMDIAMPCLVVGSATGLDPEAATVEVPWSFALATLLWFSLLLCSHIMNIVLRTHREQRGLYLFAGACTNTSFIGIPMAIAILGHESAVSASIFDMLTTVFNFTIGFAILSRGGEGSERKTFSDVLKAPVVYACLIAVAMFFTGWELPAGPRDVLTSIGGITSPVAMLVVGALVAQADFKSVFTEWRAYPFAIVRQLVLAIALFLILRAIVPEPMLAEIFALMFALPTGAIVPTFADMCGADASLAARNTVVSTLLSFALIPAVIAFVAAFA